MQCNLKMTLIKREKEMNTHIKKTMLATTALVLAACAAPGSTPAGEGGAGAPNAAPVTITMVESWFGIPQ